MLFNALTSLIHGCMGRDRPSVAVLPITADTHKSRTCTAEQWKFVTCYCMILNLLEIEFKLCSIQQQLKDSSWIISSCGHHLSERTASLMHIKHYQCENKSQSYIYYTCDTSLDIHFVNAKLLSWKLSVYYFKFEQHPCVRQGQPQKFHIGDTSLPILLLISHALREIFFNQ